MGFYNKIYMSAGYILSINAKIVGSLAFPGEIGIGRGTYYTIVKQPLAISSDISFTLPPTSGNQGDALARGSGSNDLIWSPNITLSSSGTGLTLPVVTTGPNVTIKGLSAGPNIAIIGTSTSITITNTQPSSSFSLSSLGGISVINTPTTPNMKLKSLAAGNGVSLSSTATYITITNTAPSYNITLSSAGTGLSLVDQAIGPDLSIKGYSPSGSVISITDNGKFLHFTGKPAHASAVLTFWGAEYNWGYDSSAWTDLPFNLMETNSPNEDVTFALANDYLSIGIDVTTTKPIKVLVEAIGPHNVGFIGLAGSVRIATGSDPCYTGTEVITHAWSQPAQLGVPIWLSPLTIGLGDLSDFDPVDWIFSTLSQGVIFVDPYYPWPTNGYIQFAFAEIPVTYYFAQTQIYTSAIIDLPPGTTRIRAQKRSQGGNPMSCIPIVGSYEDWFATDQQTLADTNLLKGKDGKLCITGTLKIRQL